MLVIWWEKHLHWCRLRAPEVTEPQPDTTTKAGKSVLYKVDIECMAACDVAERAVTVWGSSVNPNTYVLTCIA